MKAPMRLWIGFTCLLTLACSSFGPPPEPVHVVIAATTDVHGNLSAVTTSDGFDAGGLPLLGGYIQALRAEHGERLVVLDSGDMWQGTLASNLEEGESLVRAYSIIGYTAASVGNHEFDMGPVGERGAPEQPGDDPVGVLRRNASIANFPFLCTNILERSTGLPPDWCVPSLVVQVGGVKLGIVGAITENTPWLTQPANVAHLRFIDAAEAIADEARRLRRTDEVDAVIAATHIGAVCWSTSDPQAVVTECAMDSPLIQLASALPRGLVDVMAGGHTHNRVRHFVNGIALSQAAPYSRAISVIDLWIDPRRHRVVRSEIRPHVPICSTYDEPSGTCLPSGTPSRTLEGRPRAPLQEVADLIQPALSLADARQREPLGVVIGERIEHHFNRESPLANIVLDAMLAAAPEASIAVINSGGIRAALDSGNPTFGEIYRILPFDNTLTLLEVNGTQLEHLVALATDVDEYGLLHVGGLHVELDRSGGDNRVVRLRDSRGQPIRADGTYRVVVPDFLAGGGDGLEPFTSTLTPQQSQLLGRTVRDAVIEYLQEQSRHGSIRPVHRDWLTIRE